MVFPGEEAVKLQVSPGLKLVYLLEPRHGEQQKRCLVGLQENEGMEIFGGSKL